MKKLILLLAVALPSFLFSQSKIELLGSANYSDRHFGYDSFAGNVRSSEIGKLNYHFGINYFQQIREKLWLKIGLGFSSMGYQTPIISELRFGSQHDGMGNFDPTLPGEFDDVQFKYNFRFLEIPIALRYEFSQKRVKPFIEIGLSTLYYLESVTKTVINGESSDKEKRRDDDIIDIQLAPTITLGLIFQINKNWDFSLQPNFRYHLSKMSNGYNEHQWSGGVAIGLRRSL